MYLCGDRDPFTGFDRKKRGLIGFIIGAILFLYSIVVGVPLFVIPLS